MTEPLITGVGISDFGRFPHLTEEALAQVAIREALDDAGLSMRDVQALILEVLLYQLLFPQADTILFKLVLL